MRALGDVLEEIKRPVAVEDHENYRILGVRWYAEGAWIKNECTGSEIKASRLFRVETGDLIYNRLFAWKGSFAVMTDELDGCFVSNEFPAFRVKHNEADLQYVLMMLAQPDLWERIERDSAGVASISRKRLKVKDFLQLEVPIPDYELQQSIYARYADAKRRLQSMKDAIVQVGDDVADLRQTILQLAVMGRLVPQDPNDEPASELLKKIQAEKQRLIAEGKIRKSRPLPPIEHGQIPYELPAAWGVARLGEVICAMDAGWSPACPEEPTSDESQWGVLKTTAVQRLRFVAEAHKRLPEGLKPRPQYEASLGDILITRAGPKHRVGICCCVPQCRPRLMISDKIIRFHPVTTELISEFVALALSSGFSGAFVESQKSGMAESQMNISQLKLRMTPIPIPPYEEQVRVLDTVNLLMLQCDNLEAKLQQSQTDADNLLTSIVHELPARLFA